MRLARFEHEARVVAGLNHPDTVVLHTVEDETGTRFLTMELVEAQGLEKVVVPGRPDKGAGHRARQARGARGRS